MKKYWPFNFSFLKNQSRSLRARLLGFVVLTITIPTLLVIGVVLMTVRQSTLRASLREQREVASRVSERVVGHVENVKKVLLTLVSRKDFSKISKEEQESALRELMNNYSHLMECSVLNKEGHEVLKVERKKKRLHRSSVLVNRSYREEFKTPFSGNSYTGPVFFTSRDRVPQMFVSVPSSDRKGVLLARLSLDTIWEMVSEISIGKSGHVYIINPKGTLIAHPLSSRVLAHENLSEDPVVKSFLKGAESDPFPSSLKKSIYKDQSGHKLLAVHHHIPKLGWGVVVQIPVSEALGNIESIEKRVFVTAGFLCVVFFSFGVFLIRKVVQPLGKLSEGVQKIGKGHLGNRLKLETGDEIQKLAEEINGMAESLENLEATKTDLMHMIVHDLKSPLSSVLGSLDYVLMVAKDTLSSENKKLLSLGSKSGKDLLRMIQNLLDLGKMEEGKLEIKPETFSLIQLAGQCVDDLEAIILREKKMISIEVPKNLPKVFADQDLIHRVLANLLTNSLKHTSKGAEISIQADLSETSEAVILMIRDTGEGIPKEFLNKIFDKFGQAEGKKKNFRVGSGLGLAFCKLAVDAHGGKIWVESELGRGTCFYVELPLHHKEVHKEENNILLEKTA